MILSDREIKLELEAGVLQIDPQPKPEDISPSSIDLHLAPVLLIPDPNALPAAMAGTVELDHPDVHTLLNKLYVKKHIGPEGYVMNRGDFLLAYTQERIQLPPHLAGWVEGRSTLARFGIAVHITAPTIHPTFQGNLMLEMTLFGLWPCRLKPGINIAQLVLSRVGIPTLNTLHSVWQAQSSND